MRVINARNVNDAFSQGLQLVRSEGVLQSSRAGDVMAVPYPVITCYERPTERVLFNVVRDANPFFHLFESIWMLSGRRDATWLDRFVKDFSSRFAEDNGEQHGAYGFRWRRHFELDGGGDGLYASVPDQLTAVVNMLRANPLDRQAVICMWDPVADLGVKKRDIPCNLIVLPRIRYTAVSPEPYGGEPLLQPFLDITVFCRSNDIIWGAYGANAVHFSVLQEYLAARIGAQIGTYYQVSNNYHAYLFSLSKQDKGNNPDPYRAIAAPEPMFIDGDKIDTDLQHFMDWVDDVVDEIPVSNWVYVNPWFRTTGEALIEAHTYWKHKQRVRAIEFIRDEPHIASDWRLAVLSWMERRVKNVGE